MTNTIATLPDCDREDVLSIIEDEARSVARSFGLTAADDAAAMLVDRLVLRLAGARIPSARMRQSRETRRKIRLLSARGLTSAQLADRFGVTERWVRKILTR